MFALFAKFFSDLSSQDIDGMHDSLCNLGISMIDFDENIVNMFTKAKSCGHMNDDLADQFISYYLHVGRLNEAKKTAEDFCGGILSNGPKLWSLRISLEMKSIVEGSPVLSAPELNRIFNLFKEAISKVSVSESETLLQEVQMNISFMFL